MIVGRTKPRAMPTKFIAVNNDVANGLCISYCCTFSLRNQKVAILAGQLMMNGCPAATTSVPISKNQKELLIRSVTASPKQIEDVPMIS
jgi:hypothetical protein